LVAAAGFRIVKWPTEKSKMAKGGEKGPATGVPARPALTLEALVTAL